MISHSPTLTPSIQITHNSLTSADPTNTAPVPLTPKPSNTTLLPDNFPPGNYLIYWSFTEEELRLTSLDGSLEYTFSSVPELSSFDLSYDHQKFAYQDLDGALWIHNIFSTENISVPQPNIINGSWHESGPRWSPDGDYLVYAVSTIEIIDNQPEFEEFPSLWVSDIQGDGVEKITDWPFVETDPDWSPDGKWIAFISDHDSIDPEIDFVGGHTDLYIMPTTCLNEPDSCVEFSQKVTSMDSLGSVEKPSWSPDSERIAFLRGHEDKPEFELCLYSLINNQVIQLIEVSDRITALSWSPEADQIAYISDDDVHIISSSGGSSINLTKSEELEEYGIIQWSPDRKHIAFSSSYSDDYYGFSLVKPDGTERLDFHEMISGQERFVSWLVIPEPIEVGDHLEITNIGKNLNIRKTPSLDGNIISKLQPGDMIRIQNGPMFNDDYRWWNVTVEKSTLSGWVAEQFQWFQHIDHQ